MDAAKPTSEQLVYFGEPLFRRYVHLLQGMVLFAQYNKFRLIPSTERA